MAKKVFKYRLEIDGGDHEIAGLGQVVLVGMQAGVLCIWAEVNKYAQPRTFRVFGTGHEITESDEYWYSHVGSCLDAPYVWHVYEKFKARKAQ